MIKFHWRPLIPGERDPELLWGFILTLSFLLAACWLCVGLPAPLCPFHALTGVPCPTCGMTRGIRCLLHGDPITAFLFNPLGMLILLGMALYLLYVVIVITAKLPRLRWEKLPPNKASMLSLGCGLLIAVNWAYLIWHEQFIFALR